MRNFWVDRSIYDVIREYLYSALDKYNVVLVRNADGLAEFLCKNICIKRCNDQFVFDYFDFAVEAIHYYKPEWPFRMSDYENTVNLIIKKAARDLLSHCKLVQECDVGQNVWGRDDIIRLKNELSLLNIRFTFQRAVDVECESLFDCAYRHLFNELPKLDKIEVDLSKLQTYLAPIDISDIYASSLIKGNYEKAMTFLDDYKDSGRKVDWETYSSPIRMMQCIIEQAEKEILTANPLISYMIEYDKIKAITIDDSFINNLIESLEKQKSDIRYFNFGALNEPKKVKNRCEALY